MTVSEPDRQNHFLTLFFRLSAEGFGEEHDKKLKGNGFVGRSHEWSECDVVRWSWESYHRMFLAYAEV